MALIWLLFLTGLLLFVPFVGLFLQYQLAFLHSVAGLVLICHLVPAGWLGRIDVVSRHLLVLLALLVLVVAIFLLASVGPIVFAKASFAANMVSLVNICILLQFSFLAYFCSLHRLSFVCRTNDLVVVVCFGDFICLGAALQDWICFFYGRFFV